MAEHHKLAETTLGLHGLEGQQRPQRFTGSWPRMHQHISSMAAGRIQATAQQVNQLLLPNPWPDALLLRIGTDGKRRCCDGLDQEDESF